VPGPFPVYDKLQKQNRYRKNCAGQQLDYKLISPKDALLPWQYRRLTAASEMTTWKIVKVDTGDILDITENIAFGVIHTETLEGYDYFYYGGDGLQFSDDTLRLTYGYYYFGLEFSDGSAAYSELFFIPEDSFSITDAPEYVNYIKLEWYNLGGDIAPFYYSGLYEDDSLIFRCVCYLDSIITESQPVLTQTTAKDGDDQDIPIFQRVDIPYIINTFVPDFLKRAFVLMPLHDTINYTSADGIDSGQFDTVSVTVKSEAPGCMSSVDLSFKQALAVVNRACATNLIKTPTGTTYNYFKVQNTDSEHYDINDLGQVVVTSSLLMGKTGYGIYAPQIPNFIDRSLITYDGTGGSFTITAPGFVLIDGGYLYVFYNLVDLDLFP
jgi:hypothetical protein